MPKNPPSPALKRYLTPAITADLTEKMVFVGGPRQVGKTTLSLSLLNTDTPQHSAYLNWDDFETHEALLKGQLPANQSLIVLDEIHKYARWRNLIKGFYDTQKHQVAFLITGSAHLDYYRKGGDSLQGRYHYHRLHPFSAMELHTTPTLQDINALLEFGGFPEPLMKANQQHWRRWQKERLARVIYEDIRDLENIREISLIELLLQSLYHRVGSPLSIKNIRENLQVSHESVERWITILEHMYLCFRISPYSNSKKNHSIRAVKKEKKLYFWDWSLVDKSTDQGARFENLVASQLLKYCHHLEDTQGYDMQLCFLRDTDKREVDFVVLQDKTPLFAVECKSGDKDISSAIHYFNERTPIQAFYQVHLGKKDYQSGNVRVLPFHAFCKALNMP